jgi:DNA polymerase-3 subunit epsilon
MYAVIDLETTGLWPQRADRVLEVAVIRADAGFAVTEAWSTLVNPERDVGPVRVHGITASDVVDAPTFREIAAALATRISGAVLVGHNLRFDMGFLRGEFVRMGLDLPHARGLCTLAMARGLDLAGGRSLSNCCEKLGLPVRPDHSALADAEAAMELLRYCVADCRRRGVTLPTHEPLVLDPLPALSSASRVRARGAGTRRPTVSPLHAVLDQLPSCPAAVDASEDAVTAYADLLDRILEDRRVTDEETQALAEVATDWGLSRDAVTDIHRSYLTSLVGLALADELFSAAERADVERVAGLLGLGDELASLLEAQAAPGIAAARPRLRAHEFANKSVCFTGESMCSVGGFPLDREHQELLAAQAGMVVAPRVTKRLDLLVLADPESMSGKARTARNYGIRLIGERAFWTALGVTID